MAITKKREIGNTGEGIACKYLLKDGFQILETNFLRKCGEIDIVAEKAGKLHFIEVKSVSREILSNSLGGKTNVSHETKGYRPEDNVSQLKLKKVKKTIQLYLMEKKLPETCNWTFDVVTVLVDFNKRVGRVNMIKDIIL
jgi:putative endonuclease